MALKALLVIPTKNATWRRYTELAIAPFPGLGIRLDVYDMVNVNSVVIGDPAYDVTCIVSPESGTPWTAAQLQRLGFEIGPYP